MPNQIIHYIGENPSIYTSSMDGITLTKIGYSNQSRIEVSTNVSRFGDSSIHVGYIDPADASNYYRKQTYLFNLYPENDLSPIGNEDYTIAFWWKPTAETYYDYPFKTLFSSGGGKVINDGIIGGMDQTDFNLTYQAPADNVSGYEELSFGLDLTGNPWIHIYASRIGDTFSFIISDVNGNIFSDKDGNGCSTVYALPNNQKKNITTTTLAIGGGAGTSGIGYYDDILHLKGEGIAYNTLDLTQPLSISGEPFVTAVVSDASAGQSDGSVTVTDSNFSGTKTYTFYDSNLNILQQGVSNTLNGLQASSYTIQVSDTNGNQVSTIFAISEGGNNMAYITIASQDGLVLQKKMLRASGDLAAVLMVAEPESGIDKSSNVAFTEALTQRTAVASNLSDEAAARAADATATEDARVAADGVNAAAVVTEQAAQDAAALAAAGENTANANDRSDAMIAFASDRSDAVKVEADAELAANVALTTSVSDHEDGRGSLMTVLSEARASQDASIAVLIAAEEAAEDAALAAEAGTRASEDASIGVRLLAELSTDAQGTMVDAMEGSRIAGDSSVSVLLSAEVETEEDKLSIERAAREAGDVALVADLDAAIAARGVLAGNASDARLSLDTVIDGLIDDMITDRGTEITAEAGLRVSGQATVAGLIAAEETARLADMAVAVAYRFDNQAARSSAIAQESIDRANAVDAVKADALTSDQTLAANIATYGGQEATDWADHGVFRSDSDVALENYLSGNSSTLSDAISTESAAMSAADLSLNTRIANQASKRGSDMSSREGSMDALEAKFKFTGDAANGGDLVLEETGGLKVTATFVKINATLTKMFLS